MVSPDFVRSGEFTLERMGVTYKAKAHLKSPFDPENKRVKGIYSSPLDESGVHKARM